MLPLTKRLRREEFRALLSDLTRAQNEPAETRNEVALTCAQLVDMFAEVDRKEPQQKEAEPFFLLWACHQRRDQQQRVLVYDSKLDVWSPIELGFTLLENLVWLAETPDHRLLQSSARAFRFDQEEPEAGHFGTPFVDPVTKQTAVVEYAARMLCVPRGSIHDLPPIAGIPENRRVSRVLGDETRLYAFTRLRRMPDNAGTIVCDVQGANAVTLDQSVETVAMIATQQRLYFAGANGAIWSVSLVIERDPPVLVGKLRRPIRSRNPNLLLVSENWLVVLEPDFAQICCLSADPILWEPMTPPPNALHVHACTTASVELLERLRSLTSEDSSPKIK